MATYTLAVSSRNIENIWEFPNFVLYISNYLTSMQPHKGSQSADADWMADLPDDVDGDDGDMMCLVYPDGRTKTVSAQPDWDDD